MALPKAGCFRMVGSFGSGRFAAVLTARFSRFREASLPQVAGCRHRWPVTACHRWLADRAAPEGSDWPKGGLPPDWASGWAAACAGPRSRQAWYGRKRRCHNSGGLRGTLAKPGHCHERSYVHHSAGRIFEVVWSSSALWSRAGSPTIFPERPGATRKETF